MTTPSDIIDWHEAMQQCGEDEEFLRELLADLQSEMETQVLSIAEIIQNPQDGPYHRIMRSAHVIKGASANLMCHQLRTTALHLETAARECHEAGGTTSPPAMQQLVQQRFAEMQQAATNYAQFLQTLGI
ncbi:hypothetical protein MPSEU_000728500 [Mayamaea pseudoterrestris]|nr:hypothetical protein MPSEU_000728500 [Mayamaea pseudoterrestris]